MPLTPAQQALSDSLLAMGKRILKAHGQEEYPRIFKMGDLHIPRDGREPVRHTVYFRPSIGSECPTLCESGGNVSPIVESCPEGFRWTPNPEFRETTDERRDRVTAIVHAKWPNPLTYNQFLNTALDIIRGGHGFWDEHHDDRDEAIDALAWKNLPNSEPENDLYGPNGF